MFIIARVRNDVTGHNSTSSWRLPEDLAHFKYTTMGVLIVIGHKTYGSIGRPLPGRRNIVIMHNTRLELPGYEIAHSMEDAQRLYVGAEQIFLIGDAQLYADVLSSADRLIVTEIDADSEGDTHLPAPDPKVWHEISREMHHAITPNDFDCTLATRECPPSDEQ